MKKIAVLLIACLFSLTSFANSKNPTPAKEEIRNTIVTLLGNADFPIKKDVTATVDFIVNKKGELIILDIKCPTEQVCSFIKRKLNYKKVYKNLKQDLHFYKMPLRLVQK